MAAAYVHSELDPYDVANIGNDDDDYDEFSDSDDEFDGQDTA